MDSSPRKCPFAQIARYDDKNARVGLQVSSPLPYSLDLAPSYSFLFPNFKN